MPTFDAGEGSINQTQALMEHTANRACPVGPSYRHWQDIRIWTLLHPSGPPLTAPPADTTDFDWTVTINPHAANHAERLKANPH
jgi:hypothetical protein